MKFHFNVATEGVRAGHKYLSVLGLKWVQIDIIPPKEEVGGGGYSPEGPQYYTIRITIDFYGKKIKKEYRNLLVDQAVRIALMLKESITSIFLSLRESVKINKYINSRVKDSSVVNPSMKVDTKDVKIKVKVK